MRACSRSRTWVSRSSTLPSSRGRTGSHCCGSRGKSSRRFDNSMNDADLAGAVDANYWQSFRLLARACGGKVLERDGMLAIASGLPVAMLNITFVTEPLDDPQATLKEAVSFYDEQRLPFVVRMREGVD